jgi:hypothetical protein
VAVNVSNIPTPNFPSPEKERIRRKGKKEMEKESDGAELRTRI